MVTRLSRPGADGNHQPASILVGQRNVKGPLFGLPFPTNGPVCRDVVLALSAVLSRAHLLKLLRLDLLEEVRKQVGGLIPSEKSGLFDQTRKGEHHLVAFANSGDDRSSIPTLKSTVESRYCLVEIAESLR